MYNKNKNSLEENCEGYPTLEESEDEDGEAVIGGPRWLEWVEDIKFLQHSTTPRQYKKI